MSHALLRTAAAVLLVTVAGCDKSSAGGGAAASGSTGAPASAPAAASSAPAAASSAAAPPAAPEGASTSWEGAFTSKVGKVTPPAEAKMKLWEKDPGKEGVGPGTIKLTITGRVVSGELGGALGALVVSGDVDDKVVTARVDPKDPNTDEAWTGTLTGKLEGDSLSVVLRLSSRNANLAREADAKLTKR